MHVRCNRHIAVGHVEAGQSQLTVVRRMNVHQSMIFISGRCHQQNSVEDGPRRGRPRITTAAQDRELFQEAKRLTMYSPCHVQSSVCCLCLPDQLFQEAKTRLTCTAGREDYDAPSPDPTGRVSPDPTERGLAITRSSAEWTTMQHHQHAAFASPDPTGRLAASPDPTAEGLGCSITRSYRQRDGASPDPTGRVGCDITRSPDYDVITFLQAESGLRCSITRSYREDYDAASPDPTGRVDYDVASPDPTGRVDYDVASPDPTGRVDYDAASPDPTGRVDYDVASPDPTGRVDYDVASPDPTGRVDYDAASPDPTGRVDYDVASPDPTARVDYDVASPDPTARWCLTFSLTSGCGTVTHIEISHRALEHFADQKGQFTYQQLLRKHQDAFQAGSPYPDAYYSNICAGGKYHNISEDSHWSPFFNATLNYIRRKYPPPWDQATEKLVVFMFGFMSHQVADVLWHNLDISQGFLQTMAYINFNGVYGVAHTAGDIGGDVLTEFEMNLNHTVELSDWYVPIDDLVNIYRDLYGRDRIPKDIMEACISTLFLERLGEQLAIGKLFTTYAKKSPFLVDQFTDYFVGGIDDMSAWTQIIWRRVVYMLEHGQSECNVTHNPLYITCGQSPQYPQVVHRKSARESGIPVRLTDHGLSHEDIIVEKAYRGIRFRATDRLKEFMRQKQHKKQRISKLRQKENSNEKQPDAVYTVPEKYAKFGWSLAVGDLNNDGQDDLAIGAPGYGSEFSPQDGKVFIIYGTDNGLPLKTMDNFNVQANQVLNGPFKAQARFGSSIAIVDINMDGINDIAVGAPNMGSESTPLKYQGMVYVYYGSRNDMYRFSQVNMTISCKDRLQQWRSLSAGDLNGDGHPDLILGSPFAPGGGQQRGFVGSVYASKKYIHGVTTLTVDTLDWTYSGQQDYGWLGQDMSVRPHPSGQPLLMVSQPTFRNCSLYNCSYDVNDTQSVGRFNMFHTPVTRASLPATNSGSHHFQMFGSSFDVGHPLPGGDTILAVSAVGEDVEGKVLLVDTEFTQAGAVHLLNITNITSLPQPQVALYAGDRRYSRFGAKVKFADLNTDGYDDLIVTAPLHTDDVTEELYGAEEGRVFIFNGGKGFLVGDKALYDCKTLSFIEPCPGQKASYELKFGEYGARFGTNIAVVKSKHTVNLVVSALHSSRGDRLAGAVVVYSFPKS
ncbi:phosphatidylinositol-glycan-specific phospholipase D-like [Haliotis rubra]|uniref:phosphatidylinositol-glycan-specific phospholipase D-like n=1 Tax=Haliotis rubra TaxID=36100 RepID=UPI001EE5AAF8|nr:phosphatidylinositol-glycan-specific phospholipase D-like [Haliotis rubra]